MIVIEAPIAPEVAERLVIAGGGVKTVNGIPLLESVPTPTTTLPVVALAGTEVTIDVLLQLFTMAIIPLNVTPP
jgi:hypothetical protein